MKHRLEELMRPGRCIEGGVAYGPCLLVSRECGSGGGQIARLAGERLGWQVYDREVIDQIAQLAHVRLQLLETVDERTRQLWGDSWRPELAPEDIGYETYVRYLRQVVLALGHHGDAVIVGRGAAYFLPSRCSLRIRAVAPLEARVRRVSEADGLSPEEALRYVQRFDSERAGFIRRNTQLDVNAPVNYDLVVNTGEISLVGATELVLRAMAQKLGVHAQKR